MTPNKFYLLRSYDSLSTRLVLSHVLSHLVLEKPCVVITQMWYCYFDCSVDKEKGAC